MKLPEQNRCYLNTKISGNFLKNNSRGKTVAVKHLYVKPMFTVGISILVVVSQGSVSHQDMDLQRGFNFKVKVD